jgi:hypothetical protein
MTMSTWTIPVIVSDVRATPRPPTTGPGYPNRNFGLIGVLSISNDSGPYSGSILFTKPANFFAGKTYSIAPQFITGGPVIILTIPQAASDCRANFAQNGTYNPPGGNNPANPALFDTATVNNNGVFTKGNLSLPDFTLEGTWDNSLNTITNGDIWLPYRFLWAIWGNNPNQSQTPWANINFSFLNGKATGPAVPVIMVEVTPPSWGATGFTLQPNNGNAVFVVNLSGIGLGPNQGIALNISCAASSAPLSVSISTDRQTWNTIAPGFNASVAQQCFYIAPNQIPTRTNPFYIQLMNHQGVDAVVSAAQFLY